MALACGPDAPMTSDGGGHTGTTDPGLTTTSASSPTTTTSTTSTTEAPTSTGAGFLGIPDYGGCHVSMYDPEVRCHCSLYVQDCPIGMKCTSYSGDGDAAWDGAKCVPVVRDPGAPGEPCTVEHSVASGRDTCDVGVMCWDVDPDTLEGTCVAMCEDPFKTDPSCAPGLSCHIAFEGQVILCLPSCDPLLQDCKSDETCILTTNNAFVCHATGDVAPAAPFAPCETYLACEPGLLCTYPGLAPACDPMEPGCCLPYCDTTNPACPLDLQCLPWYEDGEAPVGLEHLGVCGTAP